MSDIKQTSGFFVGSTWSKTGTKNDPNQQIWKAQFKPKMDSQKAFTINVMLPYKNSAAGALQVNQLTAGQYYNISYTESSYTNSQNIPTTSKWAIGFFVGDPNKPVQQQPSSPQNTQADLSQFDSFAQAYFVAIESLPPAEKIPQSRMSWHMVGSYMYRIEKQKTEAILTKVQEAIKQRYQPQPTTTATPPPPAV